MVNGQMKVAESVAPAARLQDDNERSKIKQQTTLKTSKQFGCWYLHCPVCDAGFLTVYEARHHCIGGDIVELRREMHRKKKRAEYNKRQNARRAKMRELGIKRTA